MKIIIFHTYNKSLLTDFFMDFSLEIRKQNFNVNWFSFKKSDKILVHEGVEVVILKKSNAFNNYLNIYKAIKKEKPDMVLANFSYVNPAMLSAYLLGIKKRVIWFHTLKRQMDFHKRKIYIKSLFMNLATHIVTNSKELKQEVIEDYHQRSDKLLNLPFTTNIVEIPSKKTNLNKVDGFSYVGCPGRVHKDKNQVILMDALELLQDSKIILVFAGGGDHDIITSHRNYDLLAEQIIIMDTLSKNEMKSFYAEMDLIVLPSLNEAFGLVFIESIALGCKTLVSDRFGSLSYINDVHPNLSFDPQSKEELATKMQFLLDDTSPQLDYEQLYLDHFNLSTIVNGFIKFSARN